MRRPQTTSQVPEVETSRVELEHMEGRKVTIQNEVLAIADNKKGLEASFEVAKMTLEDELVDKKQETEREIQKLDQSIEDAYSRKEKAAKETDDAEANLKRTQQEFETLRDECAALDMVKKEHSDEVRRLLKQENELEVHRKSLNADIMAFESRKMHVSNEVVKAESALTEARSKTADHIHTNADLVRSDKELLVQIEERKKEFSETGIALTEKSKLLSKARADLLDAQKKQSEHETAMQKRESEANTRLANATHLETRVDGKLAQLKEAEKEFTVEHLSRIGYKPIGT